MPKFVNEQMTPAEQVDHAWKHQDLFARCRDHNFKVSMLRNLYADRGRYIYGWETDAEQLLIDHALD